MTHIDITISRKGYASVEMDAETLSWLADVCAIVVKQQMRNEKRALTNMTVPYNYPSDTELKEYLERVDQPNDLARFTRLLSEASMQVLQHRGR